MCQITADIFGLEVSRVQTVETTSLGAAIATFTAIGEFKDAHEAVEHMVKITKTFKPNMDNHQIYDSLYKDIYLKVYPRLNPLNKLINKHFKR